MGRLTPDEALRAVTALGGAWHAAGTLTPAALAEFVRGCPPGGFRNTLETGCGRSTLLLSHLSRRHTVFCIPGTDPGDSHVNVTTSDLLNREAVEFVLGPTQRTLPGYPFHPAGYDLILLDGPHAYPFPDLEYFFVYPHLSAGGVLIIDDIHIPTVQHLYRFLRADAMFDLRAVAGNTAFFTRTAAPTFPPDGDGWDHQQYNRRHFPVVHRGNLRHVPGYLAGRWLPAGVVRRLQRLTGGG